MARSRFSFLTISFCIAFCLSLALASLAIAAPQILNYQGNLSQDGQPVTATKTMVFRIYAEADDALGEALWQSGDVSVAVTNGLFSVTLGDTGQTAFPANLFDSDTRFLGITVDGVEMTERKRLASVPYAISAIPKGLIAMWSGAADQIPTGWALCNGQNGTPDLRDRFIVGAGSGYGVGSTGGTASNNLAHSHKVDGHSHGIGYSGSHGHSMTATGSHKHNTSWGFDGSSVFGWADGAGNPIYGSVTTSGASGKRFSEGNVSGVAMRLAQTEEAGNHAHPIDPDGNHNHGGSTGLEAPGTNSQLSSSVENRPPYYALCFIMKL